MQANCDPSANNGNNNLHVVTENGEQCFRWRSNELTYIAQDRQELPQILASKFGNLATKLDLSYNTLTSFKNINLFTNLSELILDNNCLRDNQMQFKQNLRLKTLSLNKNKPANKMTKNKTFSISKKLTDLLKLVSSIRVCFPNLEFLSLIGNPLCPTPIVGEQVAIQSNEMQIGQFPSDTAQNKHELQSSAANSSSLLASAYQKYRYFIIYHLPNLRFLDSTQISVRERDEALRRCYWMNSNPGWLNSAPDEEQQQSAELSLANYVPMQSMTTLERGLAEGGAQANVLVFDDATLRYTAGASRNRQEPKGAFSRLAYKYTGKNSEGNRFIRNQDL